jgi:2-polyprenyl-3-methyl-5-hydroxy-6-metoxy-1,4-benzoquinol methylase
MSSEHSYDVGDIADVARISRHWDQLASAEGRRNFDLRSWGNIRQVQENHNFLITGNKSHYWVDDFIERYFPNHSAGDTLALGCGEGGIERLLFRQGLRYRSITGYDISDACITRARQEAERIGLADQVDYQVRDLNKVILEFESYDFIFFYHSLHHVESVSGLLDQVAAAMRPHAVLLVNEFVGPSRFQWTERQVSLANENLHILPSDLRLDLGTRTTKEEVACPSISEMISIDPSEAVNSSAIDAELKRRFNIVEEKNWGGTLNYLIFGDIAGNFLPGNPYHDCIAELLVRYENELVLSHKLPSDFKHYVAHKRIELSRHDKILGGLNLANLTGVEIGPLSKPLVAKEDANVIYVDHLDTVGLRDKYATQGTVDTSEIVEIDAVWGNSTLQEALGSSTKADYIVASHVIEHVPDLIGWLQELSSILQLQGEVRLAVPDKRFTFDHLRFESTLSEAIDAHLLRRRTPLPRCVLDHFLNFRPVDNVHAWEGKLDLCRQPTDESFQHAMRAAHQALERMYCDVHCWVFTPHSFAELLELCCRFGLIDFACENFYLTERPESEFFVHLRKCDDRSRMVGSWQQMAKAARNQADPMPANFASKASRQLHSEQAKIAEIETQLFELQSRLAATLASTSWRLTAPMRTVVNVWRRLRGPATIS